MSIYEEIAAFLNEGTVLKLPGGIKRDAFYKAVGKLDPGKYWITFKGIKAGVEYTGADHTIKAELAG